MIDLRQTHIEEFNMLLILLLVGARDRFFHDSAHFYLDRSALSNPLRLASQCHGRDTHQNDRVRGRAHLRPSYDHRFHRNVNISQIFSASEQLKCQIASLIYASARIDRDEKNVNHRALLLHALTLFTCSRRHFTKSSSPACHSFSPTKCARCPNRTQIKPTRTADCKHQRKRRCLPITGLFRLAEAKAMVCLEVMQVFIMCPVFYMLIDNRSTSSFERVVLHRNEFARFADVNAIMRQALGRSPAYGSIQDVLQSFVADQVRRQMRFSE